MPCVTAFSTRGCRQQRRHEDRLAIVLNFFGHLETRAEPDFLDGQKSVEKGKLFGQGNAGFFAEPQSHAQKLGEQDAHFPRFRRVDAGERADGIQAVKQEMRIHLGLQSLQFRVARQDAGFQDTRFGGARSLEWQSAHRRSRR